MRESHGSEMPVRSRGGWNRRKSQSSQPVRAFSRYGTLTPPSSDRDQHLTPLSITNSQRYSGVSIHAQILAQLLDRRSIGPPALPMQMLILVIAACGGIWVGRRDPRGHYLFWVRSVGALGLIIVATMAFTFFGLIFPISLTLLFLLAGTTFGYHSGSPFLRK